ncbi:MAG: YoaK family protein, partial [Phycisphaerales bacterium]
MVPSTVLQSRLAISLAWIAGYVNLVALMTCGIVTSHMTGHAGALGRDMAQGAYGQARFVAALLGAFVFGAFLAGLAIEFARSRGWRRVYVLPAAIELSLLVAFGVGVELHDPSAPETGVALWWMGMIGTLAMGVQNATITRISQGVV